MSIGPGGRVAFVLKGYPRLSETFIAQEINALEQRGLDILIVSLRHPTDKTVHPVHGQIRVWAGGIPFRHDVVRTVVKGQPGGSSIRYFSHGLTHSGYHRASAARC